MVKRLTIYLGVQFAYLVFVIVIGALAMAKPGILSDDMVVEEDNWDQSPEGQAANRLLGYIAKKPSGGNLVSREHKQHQGRANSVLP
jgi:hypothetical protein